MHRLDADGMILAQNVRGEKGQGSVTVAPIGLALHAPEIPGNVGALVRLAACWGVCLHVIDPLGFVWTDRHLRRARMDYEEKAHVRRHTSWDAFSDFHFASSQRGEALPHRRVALAPHQGIAYPQWTFQEGDVLVVGRESSGLCQSVLRACEGVVHIPMRPGARSLNMALAAGIILGAALAQCGAFVNMADETWGASGGCG